MANADVTEASAAAPAAPHRGDGRRWPRLVLEIALFVVAYVALAAYQGRHLLAPGSEAPAFTLRALDGEAVSLASFRGKRTLVHFWATWCGVCRQEFGALNAIERGLAPDEALVTIAADSEDAASLRAFAAREHLGYRILLADDSVVRKYRVGAFPTNYFLTKEGRISSRTVGMSTRFSLAARLALAR